jgi:hypothetical protein
VSEPFSDEERQTARALWQELGREELAYATPAQLLAFMRQVPEPIGLKYAAHLLDAQSAQAHCFMADHDGLRVELNATRVRLSQVAEEAVEAERARASAQLDAYLAERYPLAVEQ